MLARLIDTLGETHRKIRETEQFHTVAVALAIASNVSIDE